MNVEDRSTREGAEQNPDKGQKKDTRLGEPTTPVGARGPFRNRYSG